MADHSLRDDFDPLREGNPLGYFPRQFSTATSTSTSDPTLQQRHETASALDHLFSQHDEQYLPLDPTLSNAHLEPTSHIEADLSPSQDPGSQSPPRKRKATTRINMLTRGGACEFCKKRKLKCSAETPSCASCRRSGRECVYSQKKQKSRVKVLEDRLVELERKLDGGAAGEQITPESSGSDYLSTAEKRTDPGLMTLADAAASDGLYPWEGMSVEAIAAEIAKTVITETKGPGDKIVEHLLNLYFGPPSLPSLHAIIPPSTLSSRFRSSDLPHHCLSLALLVPLLALSPSRTLSAKDRQAQFHALLSPLARSEAAALYANTDSRLLDGIAAGAIRSWTNYSSARFLEGITDLSSIMTLVWQTGLGKLGGIGDGFLPDSQAPTRAARLQREELLRGIMHKGTLVNPPRDGRELGERIHLFWMVYILDRGGAIGWHVPTCLADEEITTPWPRDDYTSPESLRYSSTVPDFLAGTDVLTDDNDFCSELKAVTLLYHSLRLLDLHPDAATPAKTQHLLTITNRFMSHYSASHRLKERNRGRMNHVYTMVYAALMFLHYRAEIDSGSPNSRLDDMIACAREIERHIDLASTVGEVNYDNGFQFSTPLAWLFTARAMLRLKARQTASDGRWDEMDRIQKSLINACKRLGKTYQFAQVVAQMAENATLGSDLKLGEFHRVDNWYH